MSGNTATMLPDFSDATIVSLLESIFLGPPESIKSLKVTAAFHAIYVLTYSSDIEYILRVAGDHVPSIKTENEAAILMWLKENTNVPVPDVIAFDSTANNQLGQEYIILSRCPGVAISDIYDSVTVQQLDGIVNQLIDILSELHRHPFSQIGGLKFSHENDDKRIIPGPVLDEHFWFLQDIQKYFPSETFDSVNYHGPFDTYTEYATLAIRSYLHVIKLHSALEDYLTPFLPRISAFIDLLPEHAFDLNKTEIRLAHKDLHFANVLYIPETGKISAIIDWEFAGTVPFPQWDPVRAFLWNAQPGQDSFEEKNRLRSRFVELCREKDARFLADAEFVNAFQEALHLVRNSLRGITTNVPRKLHLDAVEKWTKDLEKGLTAFGV